jgi:MFS family permease
VSKHNKNIFGGLIAGLAFASAALALAAFGITADPNKSAARAVVTVLVLLGAALLCAALYAVFGKPSGQKGKERKRELINGFGLAGGIVLGFLLMTALVGSSGIAFGIVQSTTLSRGGAFFIALVAIALILSMIQRWANHFAGWIGFSVLNGLLMMSSGHSLNNPSILVPRWWSISMTALALLSAYVCLRFHKPYTLNPLDKAALITWILAFTFAVNVPGPAYRQLVWTLVAMCVGCLALVLAWWCQRTPRHHHAHGMQMQ